MVRWVGIALAILSPSATSSAEQPVAAAPLSAVQFQIRFVPREQRTAVPYEIARGLAVFKVQVNGREAWALLDNRATSSLIDEAFARALGLNLNATAGGQVVTPTGVQQRWLVPEVDIDIPGQIAMRAPISATDLSRFSAAVGRPVSLIVGKEYFDNLLFLFTPGDRQFQIGPSGSLRLSADTPSIALQNDRPQIEVKMSGKPAVLTVDLAYNGDIALSRAAWERLGMDELPGAPSHATNIDGQITRGSATQVYAISLGSTRVESVTVERLPTFADDHDGLVGFGVLSRFTLALDIKARRLWLISPVPPT